MSGQYSLSKKNQEIILKILKEEGVDTSPYEYSLDDDGKQTMYHRDVKLHICSYEDKTKEFDMYIEVD